MYTPVALLDLFALPLSRAAMIPIIGGIVTGLSFALFRGRIGGLRPFGERTSESLMNFSSLGTLRCICGAKHTTQGEPDRRQFCRSCGCEVVGQDPALLEKQYSKHEIKEMTRTLRQAAIRASHLELPPSITNVEELKRYLESSEEKSPRTPPTRPTSVEQPQLR
jgi:hypothetical protein